MKNQSAREPLTFMEALEAELRKEIRAELIEELNVTEAPVNATPASSSAYERVELWLTARLNKKSEPTRPSAAAFGTYRQQASIKSEHVGSMENPAQTAVSSAVADAVFAAKAFMAETPSVRAHELDAMDVAAIEFFRRYGVSLNENFEESDLKSAYRKLAMKFHPDRHASASLEQREKYSAIFTQASEQTKRLSRHVSDPSRAAA